jgi:nucleotide-binding universal stress UspA family protein
MLGSCSWKAPEMFARILVAIDGSENSSRAADLAIDLAKKSEAALFVISVVHNPVLANPPPGAAARQPVDKARIEGERRRRASRLGER